MTPTKATTADEPVVAQPEDEQEDESNYVECTGILRGARRGPCDIEPVYVVEPTRRGKPDPLYACPKHLQQLVAYRLECLPTVKVSLVEYEDDET
jgi:hypothetical protein